MIAHHYRAQSAGTAAPTLLVMLPGAGIEAGAFAEQGMVAALRDRGLPVDVMTLQPPLELYLDGDIAEALHYEVGARVVTEGYTHLWTLGISLGAMGALLHAAHQAADVEGLFLLAPFLGTQGTIAAIAERGGFAAGSAETAGITATERRMLAWLGDFLRHRPRSPALYLGYGQADRFAEGHRLLGESLTRDCVVTVPGAHDWETWVALWYGILDKAPFASRAVAASGGPARP